MSLGTARRGTAIVAALAALLALLLPDAALGQALTLDLGAETAGTTTGRIIQLIALITILSLAPSILVMMTSFTRIVVVLSFLRTAIGLQQTPPNSVIVSLALFLTAFVMMPTLEAVYDEALEPLIAEEITEFEALDRAQAPVRDFMLRHVRESDLRLFLDLSGTPTPEGPEAIPLTVLVPDSSRPPRRRRSV